MAAVIRRTGLHIVAAAGFASTVAAAATISLVMTRPASVATAMAQHDYRMLAATLLTQVNGWVHALLRFL